MTRPARASRRRLLAALAVLTAATACASADAPATSTDAVVVTSAPLATAITTAAAAGTTSPATTVPPVSAAPTATSEAPAPAETAADTDQPSVDKLRPAVVATLPHDNGAFTQGLVFDAEGRLFESTGLAGESTLRELDPATGAVLRSTALAPDLFGEGLAVVGDTLVQITFRNGAALVYDADTFAHVSTLQYDGEGWGLCFDGERLVMSDGSPRLTFRDPSTFAVTGSVEVVLDGTAVDELNELECVDEMVYANIWHSDQIVAIDPDTGRVEAVIDATSLPRPPDADVLNGIAVDPAGEMWLTGKRWDTLYRVRLEPA